MSAREAVTPSTACGCISSSQSNARTGRQTVPAKSWKVGQARLWGRLKPVIGMLGKPFTAEIYGAPAADEAHQGHPNGLAVALECLNKPKPAATPSIAAQHPLDASPPPNKPPRATPGRRTDRYRRDSPAVPPSPTPSPNSAARVGGADPDRHRTLILVCPHPAYEAATAHHTTGNAPSQSRQPHPINFGTKCCEWKRFWGAGQLECP